MDTVHSNLFDALNTNGVPTPDDYDNSAGYTTRLLLFNLIIGDSRNSSTVLRKLTRGQTSLHASLAINDFLCQFSLFYWSEFQTIAEVYPHFVRAMTQAAPSDTREHFLSQSHARQLTTCTAFLQNLMLLGYLNSRCRLGRDILQESPDLWENYHSEDIDQVFYPLTAYDMLESSTAI